MRNSQRRFSFAVSIKARSSRTLPRAQHSRNIITRNTIPARENYGGNFSRMHQHETRTCECRWSVCAPAMLFTCKFLRTRVRIQVRAWYTWVYARGYVWNASRGNRSAIRICASSRYEDAGNAANAKGIEVIRFLLLLTLISAFSSDLDRKANGKPNERMSGRRADMCTGSTNTNLDKQRESTEK